MPSWGNFVLDKGFNAAAAITKFRAVKLTTAGETVTPVTGVGDVVIGVAQFGVTAGEITKGKGASVRMMGVTEMEASEAIAIGDIVVLASDGRAATTPTAGDRVLGICLEAAGAAGERCTVFLGLPGRLFTTGS
jgi:hypothetical protein